MSDSDKQQEKIGRPTVYRPWMNEKIIELAKQRLFLHEIAVKFGVGISTMRTWWREDTYPGFRASYEHAKSIIGSWMLRDMYENRLEKFYNERSVKFIYEQNFDLCEKRAVAVNGINAEDLPASLAALAQQLADGQFRPDEFKSIVDSVSKMFEVTIGLQNAADIAELKETLKK